MLQVMWISQYSTFKVDVEARDHFGATALYAAAKHGQTEVVKLLLSQGFDSSARDSKGWTPLHQAAFHNYHQLAQVLIDAGANL